MGEIKRGEGVTYYNVSCGKLRKNTGQKSEDGRTIYEECDGYEGKLISIEKYTSEFEGKQQNKIRLKMMDVDTGKIADISFTNNTFFAIGFFSRIINVDLDKPFTFGVCKSEFNDKISHCYIYQDGVKIEKDEKFPQPEKIEIDDGNVVYKWSNVSKVFDKIIEDIQTYISKQNKSKPETTNQNNKNSTNTEMVDDNYDDYDDDENLPF